MASGLLNLFAETPTTMFKFLRRIFGKDDESAAPVAARTITPTAVPRAEKAHAAGGVEVASLTLRAILEKLPPELRAIVNQIPDPSVKIVLPVNTIMKQLPTGAVKMSLASLLRQAPQGTFRKGAVEEKQMVDVPLSEIFKSVDPARLGRRSDQRRYDVPDDAAGLFGRNGKTRSVPGAASPDGEMQQAESLEPAAEQAGAPAPAPAAPRVMKMPGIAPASASARANGNGNGNGNAHPAPARPAPAKPQAAAAGGPNCELVISFVELAASWPEGVRSELTMVPGDTKLVIPAPAVSGGLQKGKVTFPWSQVRMWLQPALQGSTSIPDDFDLAFPLKIVAPAFVAATGAKKRREAAEIDNSIPDFFGQAQAPAFKLVESKPAAEAAPEGIIPHTLATGAHTPAAPVQSFTIVHEDPVPVVEEQAPAPAPAPEPAVPAASAPAEVVERACGLPGVAGAVIALAEGLVISQRLPEGFSAETFAAFMPQIFSRLEKYTAEMQLGSASVITIETAHGPCRIARLGKVFFGTLGRTGQHLPAALEALTKQLEAHSS